jgi:hypothetical protein
MGSPSPAPKAHRAAAPCASPVRSVPDMMRPNASNLEPSWRGNSLAMCSTSGPRGLQPVMCSTTSSAWGPLYSCATLPAVARLLLGTC